MEIFGLVIIILVLIALAATSALLREPSGHTPESTPEQTWSTLDPPSASYTMRIF